MALDRETAKEEHRSLVGRGITNTRVYVLDGGLQVAPVGVAGELYVAGTGLGGVSSSLRPDVGTVCRESVWRSGTRMYRTGDLARWRVDGVLEYLGASISR